MSVHVPSDNDKTCPSADEWRDALRGRTSDLRWAEIEVHFAGCPHCERTVDALTEQSDTFVRELCQRPSTPDDEPAFQSVYARLIASPGFALSEQDAAGASVALPMRLGHYELLTPLGQGANGTVFRARHLPLDRIVAIKLLRPDQDFDSASVERFVKEVRAVGSLDHPHVVRATDAGETDGRHFLVMEYVPGVDLSTVISRCGPLRPCDACEVVRQAARGLAYLHDNQFVHRDVKPSNLLLTANGQIKLLDLGLVQFVGDDGTHKNSHGKLPHGTADYMPPEQWQAFDQVDHRSDLYSLGCSLGKLLTGAPPFRPLPLGFATKSAAHREAPVPSLRAVRADIPDALQKVFERLLAKRPVDRFASAQELANQLLPLTRGASLDRLSRQAGLPAPLRTNDDIHGRWITRRQAVAACALAATGAVFGWSMLRRNRSLPELYPQTLSWRTLTPVVPYVFFAREEGTVAWKAARNESYQLRLANEVVLLNLGQPVVRSFRFRADVATPSGNLAAGLFFRFCSRLIDGTLWHRFQTVELQQDRSDQKHNRLIWSGYRVIGHHESASVHRDIWAETVVPQSSPGDISRLEVRFGASPFPEIFWADQELSRPWNVTQRGQDYARLPETRLHSDLLGRLGLVASRNFNESTNQAGGTIQFRRPRLLYVEDPASRQEKTG